MASFVLSFSTVDVLDEIWDLNESVSEGFLTYSFKTNMHPEMCMYVLKAIVDVKQFFG